MARWTRARGGRVVALIVDHGLRPDSAREAALVADQAMRLGAEAEVLRWREGKPSSAIQERARDARYRLLQQACRARGLLYLAVAHHADDQAETLLLRLDAGSGPLGLAGMSRSVTLRDVILLRPLLSMPKGHLQAFLRSRGLRWVEDPSNRDDRFRRTALRRLAPSLAAAGLDLARLGETAAALGATRRALEQAVLAWLARHSAWHANGYATLDRPAMLDAPDVLAETVLGQSLRAIGGQTYAPAARQLRALVTHLKEGRTAATLGGCRIILSKGRIALVREERGPPSVVLEAGRDILWDRRFRARLVSAAPEELRLEPLTRQGWQEVHREVTAEDLPGPVLWSLPCLRDARGLRALPLLDWWRADKERVGLSLEFRPSAMPGGSLFAVA